MPQANTDGWGWFAESGDGQPAILDADDEAIDLPKLAARCFRGADGQRLLAHLRRITVERAFAPDASARRLRHLEGQRHIVRYLEALVRAGIADKSLRQSK